MNEVLLRETPRIEQLGGNAPGHGEGGDYRVRPDAEAVRAVLLAIRKPTYAMKIAGAAVEHGAAYIPIEWIGEAWTAMVDAALAAMESAPAD